MEKIIVNQDAREIEVKEQTTIALDKIKTNAEKGIATTELYIPKHVGASVREKITEALDASDTRHNWCIVKTAMNQYSGRYDNFSSDTIGDSKYYKLKVY